MNTAAELLSLRVALGTTEERLADVASRIAAVGAHHCVVLDDTRQGFVGLIRLVDVAGQANPGSRILGDLVSTVVPCTVREGEPAESVAQLFERYSLGEAVVLSADGRHYRGLITAESVLEWCRAQQRQAEAALRDREAMLHHTQDQLTSAMAAQNDFLAELAHELRTPLNPVLLIASEGAANQGLPAEVRRDFATIVSNTQIEAGLVDDLLDLSRTHRSTVAISTQLVAVDSLLDEVFDSLKIEAEARGVRMERDRGNGELQVRGDRMRLQRVIANVLLFAIRRTSDGGVVQIETRVSKDEAAVEIAISDTGPRLTPAQLEHTLEPFGVRKPRPPELAESKQWAGLGLAAARSVVENYAGAIEAVEPRRGMGVELVITLPRATAPSMQPMSRFESARNDLAAHARGAILVVEDHAASRAAVAQFLRRRSYTVIEAGTVAEAMAQAGQQTIALVISDLGLPDGNGYDLMAALRKLYGLRGIALSADSTPATIARGQLAGFEAHLTKPVSMLALDQALALALRPVKV